MASTDLDHLFDPEHIALVGASGDPEKLAGRPYRYLQAHDYPGTIHLVNPSRDEIDGQPCHDSVGDIDAAVDLAMVLVPAHVAPTVVRECGEAGIPIAMVIASGFGEMGPDGQSREAALRAAAAETDIRIVGPNSEGMVNVPGDIGASFSSILKRSKLHAGGLSFLTQSGAFGGALFQLTQDLGVGAAKWLSTGNEADLSTIDFLEYLVEDPETDVIATYVEALTGGERLRKIAKRAVETETDIVAIRVGESEKGQAATASHTGSIATDDAIYEAMFAESGITRVHSVDEFTDTVVALSTLSTDEYPETGPGRGLGVVSISGGAAALIADAADRAELPLATLAPQTTAEIADRIPDYGSETNPVDVTGAAISQPELFDRCLELVATDDSVSALLLQFGNSGPETLEVCKEQLFELADVVPIATVFTGGIPTADARAELIDRGLLYFEDPVRAVRTFARVAERDRSRNLVARLPAAESGGGDREPFPTDWAAAAKAMEEAGLEVAPSTVATDREEAVAGAESMGYPVVVKYSPLDVAHKTEIDGIRTDLADAPSVRAAYEDLAAASDAEVLVQGMIDGVEAIVGVIDDRDFGPVILAGPGGTFVELFDEFAYRSSPVDRAMAEAMIEETALEALTGGFRGEAPLDRAALCDAIVAVDDLYRRYEVAELECNPVIVTESGAVAVDVLIERPN